MAMTFANQVYVVSNRAFPYCKIGKTKDYNQRKRGLNNTSVPIDFELELLFEKEEHMLHRDLEKHLHDFFKSKRVRPNREFFKLDLKDFVIIKDIAEHDGYVCTYSKTEFGPNFDLLTFALKKGYFNSEKEFDEWQDMFWDVMNEIENENELREYNLQMEREEGYITSDFSYDITSYENAIEWIEREIGGDEELINMMFIKYPTSMLSCRLIDV